MYHFLPILKLTYYRISSQDDKACFSSPDKPLPFDYTLSFSDIQQLQLLRKKIFKAHSILQSWLHVIKNIEAHCKTACATTDVISGHIKDCRHQVLQYCRRVDILKLRTSGTEKLVIFPAYYISFHRNLAAGPEWLETEIEKAVADIAGPKSRSKQPAQTKDQNIH